MKHITIFCSLMVSMYMDTIFFGRITILGICPDMTLAVIVSVAVVCGGMTGVVAGGIAGLVMDIVFNKFIGLSAIGYMIAGAVGGLFYRKFYADNFIIPGVTALACSFIKEHIMALSVVIAGGSFQYIEMFAGSVLPSVLLTGGLCMLTHVIIKPILLRNMGRQANKRIGGLR